MNLTVTLKQKIRACIDGAKNARVNGRIEQALALEHRVNVWYTNGSPSMKAFIEEAEGRAE